MRLDDASGNRKLPIPDELSGFVEDLKSKGLCPIGFRFKNFRFIYELQHLLNISDSANHHSERHLLAFAVNTDGCEQLVDVSDEKLTIFQREGDDIDTFGLTLFDLFTAERYLLGRS